MMQKKYPGKKFHLFLHMKKTQKKYLEEFWPGKQFCLFSWTKKKHRNIIWNFFFNLCSRMKKKKKIKIYSGILFSACLSGLPYLLIRHLPFSKNSQRRVFSEKQTAVVAHGKDLESNSCCRRGDVYICPLEINLFVIYLENLREHKRHRESCEWKAAGLISTSLCVCVCVCVCVSLS